jgi:hypothetical protein
VTRSAVAVLAAALAGCAGLPSAPPQNPPASQPGLAPSAVVARAAAPSSEPADAEALAKSLRELLLKYLPDPIVESAQGWGNQKDGVVGVKFHKEGAALRTEQVRGKLNDGHWRKVSVRAANPERSLALSITDAEFPEPGRATFTAQLGLDCDLKFEQQLWRNGTRLYSGETRGRCRAALALRCEVTSRTEKKPDSFIPDVVFRVRVTDAQLSYDSLVVEHTAGVGGDAARLLGDALVHAVKQAKPALERDLLAKANAAIVKAADTKEIRVSLGAILQGRVPDVTRGK